MCPEQDSNVRTGQIPFAQQGELAQCTLCRSANDLLPSLAQSLGEMIDNRRLSKADCLNVGIPLLELASGETGTRPTYRTGAALVCRPRHCRNSCLVVGLWALSRPSLALCRRSQVDPMPTLLAEESVNGAWCTIGIVHAWLRGSNLRSMATRLKDSGGGTYSAQFTVSAICSSSSGGNSFSFRATSMLITKAKSVMRATGRSPGTVPSTRMRSACWAASWPTS